MFDQLSALFSTSNWWGYGARIVGFYIARSHTLDRSSWSE
jgi:hypothetical protein